MKWFRHISDSLDDPFIFDLIKKYGGDGYMVFFGCIEMVARSSRDYTHFVKFSWLFCARKFLQRTSYSKRIILYISQSGRFEVTDQGDFFLIRIPKLKELADDYEKRKVRTMSEHSPKKHHTEADTDTDTDTEEEGKGENGGVVDQLLKQWRSLNTETAKTYPKHLGRVREAITTALNRGIKATDIEKTLFETAGKGVKPWELFPTKGVKNDETRRKYAVI